MAVITLTTDWGTKDHYASMVKGAILTLKPEIQIIDLTHQVTPFDIIESSFILKNSFAYFPKGTVHLIGVNSHPGENPRYLSILHSEHYFIAADNGIFSLLFDSPADVIIELSAAREYKNNTFPSLHLFVKAACHLATGGSIKDLGEEKKSYAEKTLLRPVADASTLRGHVVYIDTYNNAITNITRELFMNTGKGRPFTLFLKGHGHEISHISNSYYADEESEPVALFNSAGLLEISAYKGKAGNLFGLVPNDIIRIEFHDNQNR